MPTVPPPGTEVLHAITSHRAVILSLLLSGATVPEISQTLSIATDTVRSHVRNLREITGCHSMYELREFWAQHRLTWVLFMAEQAGLEAVPGPDPGVQRITLRGP